MNKFKVIILIVITLGLSGCTSSRPKICVTIYPVQYLVEQIAQDRVEICQLSVGEIIQRAQVNPDYKDLLNDADLILTMGQLEPYLQIILPEIRDQKITILDLASTSAVYDFKRYTTLYINSNIIVLEAPYYESVVFDRVDKYEKDPMLFMDPIAMTSMAKRVRDWLINNYPEDRQFFTDNYIRLEGDLIRLDAEYQILKNRQLDIKFVSITPAFGNWQKAYGVSVYPVMLSRYGVIPNTDQLEVIKNRIIADGVKHIAYEANLPADLRELYDSIREELNLTQINLSNLYTLTQNDMDNNKNYITIMYENLSFLESIAE